MCGCRQYVARQLAEQLRPELEAAVKRTDAAPGEAYSPDAASVRLCALRHTALLCDDGARTTGLQVAIQLHLEGALT